MNIIINGTPHTHDAPSIGFGDIAKLAGYAPERRPSVTWSSRTPEGHKISGILTVGQGIGVTEGMRFNCYDTSNA